MNNEREILISLIEEYAEIAALKINQERRQGWMRINNLEINVRPMVWCNEEPWNELSIDPFLKLQCKDQYLRDVERLLRQTIYKWHNFQCDMIVDPFLIIHKVTNFDEMCGMQIEEETIGNSSGIVSHGYTTQFSSLDDLQKIKMIDIIYDETETLRRYKLMTDICADIIEVRIEGQGFIHFTPWDKIAMWYKPMDILMDLMLKPELMHGIVNRYTNAMIYQLQQLESQNLLSLCNNNIRIGSGGLGYVSDLPGEKFDKEYVRPYNQWGNAMPQIFSEVSPEMHEEFALQYDRRWLNLFGLSYYGCCEPLHNKLNILKSIKNLRKISCSPWCDLEKIVSETNGCYVLSVKPSPACFADENWNATQLRKDLQRLFDITKGLPSEFIIKDISTCRNDVGRISEWARIMKSIIDNNG